MSSITLNTKVHHISNGIKKSSTVRDVMSQGEGNKTYSTLTMLDEWPELETAYKAEKETPLKTLDDKLYLARKNMMKASWWLNYVMHAPDYTESDIDQANKEYTMANYLVKDLESSLREKPVLSNYAAGLAKIAQQPDLVPPSTFMMNYGKRCIPLPSFPWPNYETKNTVRVQLDYYYTHMCPWTTTYPHTFPKGTRFNILYVQEGSDLQKCDAVMTKEAAVFQLRPERKLFMDINLWLNSLPDMHRACIEVIV